MNGYLKISLQIAFVILLIWIGAALVGAAPGASFSGPGIYGRLGARKRKRHHGRRSYNWISSGMTGDLVQSNGLQSSVVGLPQIPY